MQNHRTLVALVPLLALALVACGSAPKAKRAEAKPLRVLVYNIRHGDGMDRAVNLARTAEVIRKANADIVLLQEVDQVCQRSGGVDQAAALGELCGMDHRFGMFRAFEDGHYGMAALSRLPIKSSETIRLPPEKKRVAALELVVDHRGREVVVTGLHLVQTEEERLAQARFLLERYEGERRPIIIGGDLNSERTSSVLAALYTRFDAPEKSGSALTFPADNPTKEIDYVLTSPRGAWTVTDHVVLEELAASDHRPVLLEARMRR